MATTHFQICDLVKKWLLKNVWVKNKLKYVKLYRNNIYGIATLWTFHCVWGLEHGCSTPLSTTHTRVLACHHQQRACVSCVLASNRFFVVCHTAYSWWNCLLPVANGDFFCVFLKCQPNWFYTRTLHSCTLHSFVVNARDVCLQMCLMLVAHTALLTSGQRAADSFVVVVFCVHVNAQCM